MDSVLHQLLWLAQRVLGLCLILLASGGAGELLVRRVPFASRVERLAFALPVGLGCWALVLFGLAVTGLLYYPLIVLLTVLGAAFGLYRLTRIINVAELTKCFRSFQTTRGQGIIERILIVSAVGYFALLLVQALYPPTHYDATSNHLLLAREYLLAHRPVVYSGIPNPLPPALNHMLFVWAMAISDDILAQMIEYVLMTITGLGLYAWGRRQGQPRMGLAMAVCWTALPAVLWLGRGAYVDIGVTTFAFLGVYALRVSLDTRAKAWWPLGMALLGMATGAKLTGGVFVALGLPVGLYAVSKSAITWRTFFLGLALAAALLFPWYAYIAHHTGNPLWPTLPQLSNGVWGDEYLFKFNRSMAGLGVSKTVLHFLALPVYVSLSAKHFYDPSFAYWILILWPAAWVAAGWLRSVRWWSFWAIAFAVFWFLTSQQLRLLLPAVPFAILGIYETAAWCASRVWNSTRTIGGIWVIAVLLPLGVSSRFALGHVKYQGWPPTTPAARDRYVEKAYLGFSAMTYINERATADDAVFVIFGSWLNYYFKPRVIDVFALGQRVHTPAFRLPEDREWVKSLQSSGVNWIFVGRGHRSLARVTLEDPNFRPEWPPYQLVYEDSDGWVFQLSPPTG